MLFNNAGINPTDDSSVLETSLEAWQRVQDVNLRSVFLCCKPGIPHLLAGDGGSVINTASFVAVMGAAVSQISYTSSKGGVLSLSRELGVEFARRLPMGRFAEAREVAQAALFLASDESSYVTASTFLVDGGLSAAYLTPE